MSFVLAIEVVFFAEDAKLTSAESWDQLSAKYAQTASSKQLHYALVR